jgi:hypothetical protein
MSKRFSLTWQQLILVTCVMLICALLFWNPKSQSSSWIFPYFSGAANLGLDLVWRVDQIEFSRFSNLSYVQQMDYRFTGSDLATLSTYSVLDKGYVFVIWVAQTIFLWLPQIKAVIWLQIFFHIVSSLWVLGRLGSRLQQIIFLLAYAVNPVVLHFVTFAYHYYWQVIPSLAWFWYMTLEEPRALRDIYLLVLVLSAAFLIRQSTVIISIIILSYGAWRCKKAMGWATVVCFLAFVVIAKNPSQPWHTAYVGIGAYPNNAQIELDDESGYRMFKNASGIQINTTPPDGNYYDETIRSQYYGVLKEQVINYWYENPVQLIRNAALNTLQGFSVGYPVGHLSLAYASACIGLISLTILIAHRMFVMATLIFAGVAGFSAYYPPIPAYMFGNYFLLVIAFISIIEQAGSSSVAVALVRNLKERFFRLP